MSPRTAIAYSASPAFIFLLYTGLSISKPNMISLLEQGKEPWIVEKEMSDGQYTGEWWELGRAGCCKVSVQVVMIRLPWFQKKTEISLAWTSLKPHLHLRFFSFLYILNYIRSNTSTYTLNSSLSQLFFPIYSQNCIHL